MMHLTHRNRVEYSRLNRLEIHRCGPPSPAERALLPPFSVCRTKWKCTETVYGSLSKVDAPKPSPLWEDTCKQV